MGKIVPLKGFILAAPSQPLKSLEEEAAKASGFENFVVVDSKTGRDAHLGGKTRVRLFTVVEVYENCAEELRRYVGKSVYCVCFENEKENNIIVEDGTGRRLFIIPERDILAELRN